MVFSMDGDATATQHITGDICCAEIIVEIPEWWNSLGELGGYGLPEYINAIAAATLRHVGLFSYTNEVALTVLLTGDEELYTLNTRFRCRNKATNVLSFPSGNINICNVPELYNISDLKFYLGDIAISYHRIYQESLEQAKTFREHFVHIVVHGVLHLIGYNHEDAVEAKRMESIEVGILSTFGIRDPYIVWHLKDR